MRALGKLELHNSSISGFINVDFRHKSGSSSSFDLYLFFIASITENNSVSQRYDVLKGIKNFKALWKINPYSALLLGQKSLNKSSLNLLFTLFCEKHGIDQ